MTIEVQVLDAGAAAGGPLKLRVRHPGAALYGRVQVEVCDAGVRNPAIQFGTAAAVARSGDDTVEAVFDTGQRAPGLYEVMLVKLHEPKEAGAAAQLDLWGRRDFERALFEIAAPGAPRRDAQQVAQDVAAGEAAADEEFLTPLGEGPNEYSVFVFVRELHADMHVRFRGFELVPAGGGVGAEDACVFVNAFMQERTRTGLKFAYDEPADALARQNTPGCAVHFPRVRAASVEAARDFGIDRANQLLLALSGARDTGGAVLEVVVLDHGAGRAMKFAVGGPVGTNRATGALGGNAAVTLEQWLDRIAREPVDLLLLELYRQARHDPRPALQYVRYWQALELAAEAAQLEAGAAGVLRLLERAGVQEDGLAALVQKWQSRRNATIRGDAWQAPASDLGLLKGAVQQVLVHRLSAAAA